MVIAHLTDHSPAIHGAEVSSAVPEIAFDTHVFPNGLRLVVHEDRTTPRVAIQVRYDVGAKDEQAGHTGFAHLFEHLMFKGSANRPGGWFESVLPLGATNINGTTNYDRTNFYQTVPSAALDRVLWMEADRMGFLLEGIDAQSLAEEIEVVKNEKRQYQAGPVAATQAYLHAALYPRSHPYGHDVIGDDADLDAATLETAAWWHRTWYGASNAVIALAGDIDFETAKAKVGRWFGDLPSGEPLRREVQHLPPSGMLRKLVSQAQVPHRSRTLIWHSCGATDPDSALLELAASILGAAPRGRIFRRLVEQEQLCVYAGVGFQSQLLCGLLTVDWGLAPGADMARAEEIVEEELERFRREGPLVEEMDEVRQRREMGHLQALEGIESKVEILSNNMLVHGAPDGDRHLRQLVREATGEDVRKAFSRWCAPQWHAADLTTEPFAGKAQAPDTDRSIAPELGEFHAPVFPAIEHARLANGLEIRLAHRPLAPQVSFNLLMAGGHDHDPLGKEGLTGLTLNLLSKEKKTRSVDAFDASLNAAGIAIGMWADGACAGVTMTCLPGHLREAMAHAAEFVFQPAYREDEFAFHHGNMVRGLEQARMPAQDAQRAINQLSLGFVREPSLASVTAIGHGDVIARYQAWLDPEKAVLFVAGNVTLDEVVAAAQPNLANWPQKGAPLSEVTDEYRSVPGNYFIAAPGEAQTSLTLRCLDDRLRDLRAAEAVSVFTTCLQERLSRRLRGPGWTYGVGCGAQMQCKLGFLQITTSVQADRTRDALAAIEEELVAAAGDNPVTQEEFERVRSQRILGLVSNWTNNASVIGALQGDHIAEHPEGFAGEIEARVRAVSLEDVQQIGSWFGDVTRFVVLALGDQRWLDHDRFKPVPSALTSAG